MTNTQGPAYANLRQYQVGPTVGAYLGIPNTLLVGC